MDREDTGGLLQDALAGEQTALARLVAGLTPVIQARVARKLLTRRQRGGSVRRDVEDLTQDVFLSLFAKEGRVLRSWQAERGLSLENFVGLVAECQVMSFLRTGKRNPYREEPMLIEDMDTASAESGPEEVTATREELRAVLDRLREKLSPLGWRIFDLLFIQELTHSEVMSASGLSADAVYAWRSRLRRLAQDLAAKVSGKPTPERTRRRTDSDD